MNTTCVNTTEGVFDRVATVQPVDTSSTGISSVFKKLANILVTWQRRVENRQHLLDLDERLLRDIGLSRYDALKEAAKPFWKD
ncbi:MAG TPA: DUF1127 domain-containing protein [Gammaproteobacteria bacterium]